VSFVVDPREQVHQSTLTRSAITAFAAIFAGLAIAATLAAFEPEVIRSIGAVSPEVGGRFRDPAAFQQAAGGQYFVFDRRGHTVYGIDAGQATAWKVVQIGAEAGRIIDPTAFAVAPNGTFVVADAPDSRERVQIFTPAGVRIGGFTLRPRVRPRVTIDNIGIGGIGSLQYSGTSILLSQPDLGALISEYTLAGGVNRLIGTLRPTGHEDDADLHLALNAGLPLLDPTGGFFFVFQTGEPMFRKYNQRGEFMFERRIQGREIDDVVANLATTWPPRQSSDGEFPFVPPTVRTAAVDRAGRLWVSLMVPYTYVFDRDGDKIRTVQFQAAGILSPASFFFSHQGHLLVTPGLYQFQP
jgi:hypothetical protein